MKKILSNKKYLYAILLLILSIFIYENYIKYVIIMNKRNGYHYNIDGEHVCYHNYEWMCENDECSQPDYPENEHLLYSGYFKNLYDTVKFAENNYSKYYDSIPKEYRDEYYLHKGYWISSICEKSYDDNIHGYGVTFLEEFPYDFYKDHPEYIYKGRAYTFKEAYDGLKSLE